MLVRPPTPGAGYTAGDELDSRAPSGHGFNFDGVLHGLSEDDMDIMRLREENEVLMNTLVRSKLEMAETQSASARVPSPGSAGAHVGVCSGALTCLSRLSAQGTSWRVRPAIGRQRPRRDLH